MSEIDPLEAPALLLRMVPETAEHIAEMYEMPAAEAVRSEAAEYDTFALLDEAFTRPVVQPELRRASPDFELMSRCFEFVDLMVRSSTRALTGPVHFQVLEALLEEEMFLERTIPFMQERTRKETAQMLIGYGNPVPEELLR
ncbi:hypothetical protein [Streptomyces halobius]|uniref:Uncharacterized protein n=1 Tax=Streptomyces halobius TaxID=2879846 RepID=A0ABY4M8C7_9ACTN|nr:hypothetical protein [Streptomyces halobius]UQA92516.1 hypothetical protein K9S39_12365 [Streptomyces halobius]